MQFSVVIFFNKLWTISGTKYPSHRSITCTGTTGILERYKTWHCWGWSARIVSWVLGPWRRGWEVCTEWGLVAQRLTTDSCPVVTGHIDPQQSPCWLPTTVVSIWSGRRGGGTWQWPTGSMSSSVMSRDSNFTREMADLGYAVYLVSAPGQGAKLIGSKLVVVRSTYPPLVLPDGYLTGVLYRGILQKTLVPFARHHFGDNYRYQDNNATPHRARVVLDFIQQGNVTKMEQPPRSPDCDPIEHLWDELGRAISSMDNPPQNLDELHQALLDKWAQIPVQCIQRLVQVCLDDWRRLSPWEAGIPDIDLAHTKRDHQAASRKKSSLFDQIYHNYLPVTFRYAHSANHSFYHQMSSKLTKHNRMKIERQIHRKHYITPNNLSLYLADWWNRNNHKKRHIIPGCNNLFDKSVLLLLNVQSDLNFEHVTRASLWWRVPNCVLVVFSRRSATIFTAQNTSR